MTTTRRTPVLAVLLVSALAVAGCSTLSKVNPFHKKEPKDVASEGERISLVPADQRLEPAESLKGVDFSLPAPVKIADWPLPGGTPEQSVGNVDAAPSLTIAWKRGFGEKSKRGHYITAPPIEADGRVYVMDSAAGVSARNASTGAEVWRTSVRPSSRRDKDAFGGGLAYADGKIYVASGYRVVAQLDAATGKVGWTARTGEPIHDAPTVTAGRVVAVGIDNTLMTFDTATGAPGWTYEGLSEPARILGASSPAVSGDTMVAAFGSGELVALRVTNGNDLWNEALSRASRTSALSEIRDIPGRPVIYQGDVYAMSHSGVFSATDLRTGQARWSLPVVGVTTPIAAGDVVYVVSKAGLLICAARDSGQIYWVRDLNPPVAAKKKGFHIPGLGGKKTRPLWSSPLLANGRILVAGSTGELLSVDGKTGVIQRRIDLGAPVLLGPIAANGMVYLVSDTAQLIALR